MSADAGHTEPAAAEPSPARMRWEDIRKDPEYSAEISKIVRERLKEAGTARQTLDTLMPGLKNLAQQQGMDPENPDYQALAQAMGSHNGILGSNEGIRLGQEQVTQIRLSDFLNMVPEHIVPSVVIGTENQYNGGGGDKRLVVTTDG
jgi:hypothetical protein